MWDSPRDDVEVVKLSAKYEGDDLVGYSLRDFVDEDTPHGNWDGKRKFEFNPEELRQLNDATDMALMNTEEI